MSDSNVETEHSEIGTLLICGWSPQGRRAVDDLNATTSAASMTIMARTDGCPTPPIPDRPGMTHRSLDSTSHDDLVEAGLHDADVVVLLADRCHSSNPDTLDARTVLTALTIRELDADIHVIAELISEDNRALADDAGIDETILADRFSGVMLSQSLQSAGLSELFTRLFETGAGAFFDERPVPQRLVGSAYGRAVAEWPSKGLGAVAGLKRGDGLHLPPDEDIELEASDKLLVMRRV